MAVGGADPWIDWGGQGPVLHFAHGNGFPPRCYGQLLESLTDEFQVFSWEARPLWPGSRPESVDNWSQLAADLTGAMWSRGMRRVLGVGHSLGGTLSMMAAASEPDLFAALVVIDPVVFTGFRSRFWQIMKRTGQSRKLPLLRGAQRRIDRWPDREAAKRSWSGKAVFENWTATSFDAYLEHGLEEDEDGGLRLRYPKGWEARIFELTPHDLWPQIVKVEVPILMIRGEHSDTFLAGAAKRMEKRCAKARCETVSETGHMLPMENPDQVARLIRVFAAEAGVKTLSP